MNYDTNYARPIEHQNFTSEYCVFVDEYLCIAKIRRKSLKR